MSKLKEIYWPNVIEDIYITWYIFSMIGTLLIMAITGHYPMIFAWINLIEGGLMFAYHVFIVPDEIEYNGSIFAMKMGMGGIVLFGFFMEGGTL
jgi:hypothetical protein